SKLRVSTAKATEGSAAKTSRPLDLFKPLERGNEESCDAFRRAWMRHLEECRSLDDREHAGRLAPLRTARGKPEASFDPAEPLGNHPSCDLPVRLLAARAAGNDLRPDPHERSDPGILEEAERSGEKAGRAHRRGR